MALTIDVKVTPKAAHAGISLDASGRINIKVTSAPEHSRANNDVIALLAERLHVPKQDVEIVSGAISRYKKLRIHGFSDFANLCHALGLEVQQGIGVVIKNTRRAGQ